MIYSTGDIFAQQSFTNGDTTVVLNLHGQVDNFSPRVELPTPFTTDCGLGIEIPALIEDVDGDRLDISWYVDGNLVARDVETAILDLALGTHVVAVVAEDGEGGFGSATMEIEVTPDVTPPEIIEQPVEMCLWPPNHGQTILTSSEVSVIAVDESTRTRRSSSCLERAPRRMTPPATETPWATSW